MDDPPTSGPETPEPRRLTQEQIDRVNAAAARGRAGYPTAPIDPMDVRRRVFRLLSGKRPNLERKRRQVLGPRRPMSYWRDTENALAVLTLAHIAWRTVHYVRSAYGSVRVALSLREWWREHGTQVFLALGLGLVIAYAVVGDRHRAPIKVRLVLACVTYGLCGATIARSWRIRLRHS